MAVVEKQKVNKKLYRIFLLSTKVIPILLAIFHFLNTVFAFIGWNDIVLNYIAGISILPICYLYLASYTFYYCKYYRMYLHYCVICNIINVYDYYIGIPLDNIKYFECYVLFTIIFMFLVLYKKVISKWQ